MLLKPKVNPNSNIKTKCRYLEQPFSSPFFFSEAVALVAASNTGFWLSVQTYQKDLAATLLYTCMIPACCTAISTVQISLLYNHMIRNLVHGAHCGNGRARTAENFVFQFRLQTEQRRQVHLHRTISESSHDAV